MTESERNRVIARAVTMSLAGIITVVIAYQVRQVLLTLYVSGLLAVGLSPIVRRIEHSRFMLKRRRVPRWLALLHIYIGFLLAVAFVMWLTVPTLIEQVRQLADEMPNYMDRMLRALSDRGLIRRQASWTALFPQLSQPGAVLTNVFGAVQGVLGVMGAL